MRELSLNGYIDDESWFGDEITPESLHDLLYGTEDTLPEDVHIRLNSYGGSCNAAVRMFDDIRAYPGNVMSNYQIVRVGDFVLNNQQAWRGSVGVSRCRRIQHDERASDNKEKRQSV